MWRFLLPARFAMAIALILLFSDAVGDAQSVSDRASSPAASPDPAPGAPAGRDQRAADLQRQVSDLQELVAQVGQQLAQRKEQGQGTGGQQSAGNLPAPEVADPQQQDNELHSELQGLITQLEQELQLEEQSPPATDAAEQHERQAARDALRHEIADLRQQDNELQGLMTGDKGNLARREAQKPPAPDTSEHPAADDTAEHQAADLRSQIADLQRQDDALQRQLAQHKQELAQHTQELAERTQELDAARAEADRLHRGIDALRRERQAEEASLELERVRQGIEAFRQRQPADVAASARPKAQEAQAATATMAPPAASKPTPQPAQTTQPIQPMTSPAPRPMPTPSALQQLQTAQHWLSAGRPDEARRVLAMVQTQVVFQPGTQDGHDVPGSNPTATNISDAIRLLDMGAGGQAMQSITRAIGDVNPQGGAVRARSGVPTQGQ